MAEEYIYATARIHANESHLLNFNDIEQLVACRGFDEAVKLLADKGFGALKSFDDYEQMLEAENLRTWALIAELYDDLSVFDALRLPADFHNLKAAIKAVCTDTEPDKIFLCGGIWDGKFIYNAVLNQEIFRLPEYMQKCAKEAKDAVIKLHDGQLCDIIIDKALLEAMIKAAQKSNCDVLKQYVQLYTAQSDIKIAVRGIKTYKSAQFFDKALAECDLLDKDMLKNAALGGLDDLCEYLKTTQFSGAADCLAQSLCAFEKYCDNLLISSILPQKYNSFTLGPAVAYILARENEIKAVRMVLCAKKNDLPQELVQERLRDMYV